MYDNPEKKKKEEWMSYESHLIFERGCMKFLSNEYI